MKHCWAVLVLFAVSALSVTSAAEASRHPKSHLGHVSPHRSGRNLGWVPAPKRIEFENERQVRRRGERQFEPRTQSPKRIVTLPVGARSVFAKRAVGITPVWSGIPGDQPLSAHFPADAQIAVGAGAVVEMANSYMSVWTTGGVARTSMDLRTFAASSDDLGDSRVLFDVLSGRWFAAIMDGTLGSYGIFIAVSKSADPTAGWWVYKWTSSLCLDQPRLGVANSTVTFTTNSYSSCATGETSSFVGTQIWVLNEGNLLDGASVSYRYYDPDIRFFTLSPAQSATATDTQYMVSLSRTRSAALVLALVGTAPVPATYTSILCRLRDLTSRLLQINPEHPARSAQMTFVRSMRSGRTESSTPQQTTRAFQQATP